ncbi:MAG: hypothetical protein A3F84_14730 [Candidatus Handelsmanbacteria bacterium RIFCSPLOWO2_12_FULL_64_10]|uniref:DUF433 domain-containing protein n=1 Tax=Handelsmanbacteria sp. (strain RIFCSPLOWO2_12_FULL_64_10) TaxID=1817868 RepID=A0A1F6CZP1_HANXR|nr:MAG: hypothetical protein A3F84_14730 [Candidatus Handelsmanbacteria bacterium RIFCSPLOWO2_12_FULL_64_10]
MRKSRVGKHLVIDPAICHGQLTFAGTRIPVQAVLTFLKMGYSMDRLLSEWPELRREAIEEAVELAAEALLERYPPALTP